METPEPRENRTEKIREQIRHLTALPEDYSDEIPERMISYDTHRFPTEISGVIFRWNPHPLQGTFRFG